MVRRDKVDRWQPRPERGRALFHHRDSGGRHETTPGEYIRWAQKYSAERGLRFDGTPERIEAMAKDGRVVDGDVFLDWDVSGNQLSRPALNALFEEAERDRTVSHVLIPRPDRLARPNETEQGVFLERKFRQTLGVWLVFTHRELRPIKRGESMNFGEWITAAVEYEQAGRFRRELAEKMLLSQLSRARDGFSTGGRAKYGLQRWLIAPDGTAERPLADGESVRRAGYHVAWLPKDDATFAIRLRIKRMLIEMPATQVAKTLTAELILTPDFGRRRRDNGIEHLTSGVWHATTVVNIGRDQIDAGIVTYGKRSIGDQLRFSPDGPRTLEEGDFRSDDQPRVVQNPTELLVTGPAHFRAPLSAEDQNALTTELDRRAGTQRGKPRSRDPKNNPLGARVFDMDCSWPMYRQPYTDSFRYTCGLYQQSHGAKCAHNHVNGPAAARLVLECLRQRVLLPDLLPKLRQRLRLIAEQETRKDDKPDELSTVRSELRDVERQLPVVRRNMALAETDNQRQAMATVFEELEERKRTLTAKAASLELDSARPGDVDEEVKAAMELVHRLTALAHVQTDHALLGKLFRQVNAKLFVGFTDAQFGKRVVRKPCRGVVTFGDAPTPIEVYAGPTTRTSVKQAIQTAASSAAVSDREGDALSPEVLNGPRSEGDPFGNVNQGDRI